MRTILALVTSLVFASPVHASPLTWLFSGTTSASSQFNGMPIGSEHFELRIFLDTDLVGMKFGGLADVFFNGPHQGEVAIDTVGVVPVGFLNVQYFAPGGLVTGVQYNQPPFSGIQFASSISTDSLHLSAIPPTAPSAIHTISFVGPNGLTVTGAVMTFTAVAVPEGGSTALFLALGTIAPWLLWRRRRRFFADRSGR